MATVDRKGGRRPAKGTPNHFEKLLKGPCPNHTFPVKHLYKDCGFMKQFLFGGSNKGEHRGTPSRPQMMPRGRTVAFRHWMVAS